MDISTSLPWESIFVEITVAFVLWNVWNGIELLGWLPFNFYYFCDPMYIHFSEDTKKRYHTCGVTGVWGWHLGKVRVKGLFKKCFWAVLKF